MAGEVHKSAFIMANEYKDFERDVMQGLWDDITTAFHAGSLGSYTTVYHGGSAWVDVQADTLPKNCANCAAPLSASVCAYCGTNY